MDYQEAPLNLSRRKTPDVFHPEPTKQEVDLNFNTTGAWAIVQNPLLMSKVMPWCYSPWAAYPQLHIAGQNLQYQQAYWNAVRNLFQDSIQAISPGVPSPTAKPEEHVQTLEIPSPSVKSEIFLPVTASLPTAGIENSIPKKLQENSSQKGKKTSTVGKSLFTCSQCGVSYPHRFELNRHIKVSHIRPHRCDHCGKGFGHKNYLHVHIETVHLGRKMHKCELCGKYLSTGGNLSVHVRTIHMGEKKYKCSVCSRTFGQQCNMKTHMKRHFCKPEEKRIGRINSC